MITKKERQMQRPTNHKYFLRSIIAEKRDYINKNERDIQGIILMLLIWGMGAVTGAIWCFLRLAR